jgi:hypothetical protein
MVERRRTFPASTTTAQRPQRPCPPHGWATSSPASRSASVINAPVGTATVVFEG